MKLYIFFILAISSLLFAQKFDIKTWGNDVVKHEFYGIKMGMEDTHVRKVFNKRELKTLINESALRLPSTEYVEIEKKIKFDPKAHRKFMEKGHMNLETNPAPDYTLFVRYKNDTVGDYPIKEDESTLPYLETSIKYHEYIITTNGTHKSLPFLISREKAKLKAYLNQDSRVVAIEMVFPKLYQKDKKELYMLLDDEYSKNIQSYDKGAYFYVSKNIMLHSGYGEKFKEKNKTTDKSTAAEYCVTNFYYHKIKFPEALKAKCNSEPEFKDLI